MRAAECPSIISMCTASAIRRRWTRSDLTIIYTGTACGLIEWADLIEEILPEKRVAIRIEKDLEKGFDYRRIIIQEEVDK